MTEHFKDSEFACKCCGVVKKGNGLTALQIVLEDVRCYFVKPVTVTSAYRCVHHNRKVGGVDNSQHVQGTAADIQVKDVRPAEVADYLRSRPYANLLGIGQYDTFTHVDVRGTAARW